MRVCCFERWRDAPLCPPSDVRRHAEATDATPRDAMIAMPARDMPKPRYQCRELTPFSMISCRLISRYFASRYAMFLLFAAPRREALERAFF